jgi:hypothetical protein
MDIEIDNQEKIKSGSKYSTKYKRRCPKKNSIKTTSRYKNKFNQKSEGELESSHEEKSDELGNENTVINKNKSKNKYSDNQMLKNMDCLDKKIGVYSKYKCRNKHTKNPDKKPIDKCDYERIKKLCNIDLCILGKKLIFSGALLQENLALFLKAQAEKINKFNSKINKNQDENVSFHDLLELNKSVKDTIYCIAEIEDRLTTKIMIGEKLLNEKDSCPSCCESNDDDNNNN